MRKALLILLICPIVGWAQGLGSEESPNPGSPQEIGLLDHLPPLTILIDSAIAHSPEVERLDYETMVMAYNLRTIRKDWSQYLFLNGQYLYNDYEQLVFDITGAPVPRQMLGYQLGVGARIPLNTFIGRKDRIMAAEMEVKSARAERRNRAEMVREEVIQTYNQLLLVQRLIGIMTEAKESYDLMLEMGEKRFKEGEVTLEDLAVNTDMKTKYSAEHERLKAEYTTLYARLERLVGHPLAKLKNLNE